MKKIGLLLPLVFLSGLSAQTAETIVYRALLSNTNEIPAAPTAATGTATVWLHLVRDATGAIISGSADANVNYSFPGSVSITAMHIHTGSAAVNGAVVVPFGIARIDDTTGVGAIPPIQTQFPTSSSLLDTIKGIVADPSQFYFNVHTTVSGGGAMRGQLQKADVVVRMAQMRPENETPAITGQPWSALGAITTLVTRDAKGAYTSAYTIFDCKYAGFPDDTAFTGMHIHLGAAGVAGPVTLNSGLRGQLPVTPGGSGTIHLENEINLAGAGVIDSLNALINNPAGVYYNLHTVLRGGGAVRGQVLNTDRTEFKAILSPDQENPPIANTTATAIGSLQVYTIRNQDGTVGGGVVMFDGNTRFPAGSTVTATHVHDGLVGLNGPVTIDSGLNKSPILVADGTGNLFRIVTVDAGQPLASLNDLLINPEKHYWNIHTTANPGGVVRFQLGKAVTTAPVIVTIQNGTLNQSQAGLGAGGLVSIFGTDFAKVAGNTAGYNFASLPTSLNGVSVTVDGQAAPLLYVGPTQVNAQVPFGVTAANPVVVVTSTVAPSAAGTIGAAAAAPAIFSNTDGGIVFRAKDGTLISAANPATAGDSVIIYATGLGQTTPSLATGKLTPGDVAYVTAPVAVTFGTTKALVTAASAVPGLAGVYQVTATVPAGLTAGMVTLKVEMISALSLFGSPRFAASNLVNVAVQ
ncbi:MAG TPA: CHRD domain-containing protein [Bryobacteraceae bacterium]|nr:CHRD domain-containing protein [Bryobacteraceae bacterium]